MLEKMPNSFLTLGVTHRWLCVAFLSLATIFFSISISELRIDTSMDSLIANDEPMKPVYDRIVNEFGSDDTTIIYIKDVDLWSPKKLAALDELHYELQNLDAIHKVDSLYNVRSIRDIDGILESDTVLVDVPTDKEVINQAKENALYSPLLRKNFISESGLVTAINVTLKTSTEPNFGRDAHAAIQKVLDKKESAFEEIFAVGSPRVNYELKDSLFNDLFWLGPFAAGILMATIIVFLRSGFAAFVPILSAGLAIVWTFGFMALANIPLNVLSAMLPSLIIVIGATEDTHMLSVYLAKLDNVGTAEKEKRRRDAAIFMAKHVGIPVILTTLTTFFGFAANSFSSMDLIRDFAFASAFGIAANGLITILLVPLILSWFGPTKTSIVSDNKRVLGVPGLILLGLNYLRRKHKKKVSVVTLILFCFCAYQALDIRVSNDPMSYFKEGHQLVIQNNSIHEDLAGTSVFYITLETNNAGAFRQPENLERLVKIKAFIKKQAKLDQVFSITDHLSLVNREWSGGDPVMYRPPAIPELVDQYMLFFQRRDVENYVNHDFSSANMVVRHNIKDSYELRNTVDELDNEIHKIVGSDIKYSLVGKNLMVNNAAERLMTTQVVSLGLLLAVVAILMSVLFTSWRGGAISLVPNLLPITWVFGLMAMFEIPINPGTATVAVIAIGIAIDDTIHLLTKFNEESRATENIAEAVEETVNYEAIPVISTSISLMLGFAVLIASEFSIVSQFGALAAATMFFALIADLLITPIIMGKLRLVSLADVFALKLDRKLLQKSALFQGMSWFAVKKSILLSKTREFTQGDVILYADSIGREMFLILEGAVCVQVGKGKAKTELSNLGVGEVFGEIGFVGEFQRSANVVATEKTKLLEINYQQMQSNMRLYPHIAARINLNISRILGKRLAKMARNHGKITH
jgi:predicted RND superfamily exporter protein